MSLKKKVVIAILIVGFLALALGLFVTYYQVRGVLTEKIGKDFAELAEKTAKRVDSAIEKEITIFRYLARNKDIIEGTSSGKGSIVDAYLRYFLGFEEEKEKHIDILVVDRKGVIIANGNPLSPYNKDQSGEKWWKVINENGKERIYLSDIYVDKKTGYRVMDIGIPVVDPEREVIVGGIRDIINADIFFSFIRDINFGRTGHGMLINSEGTPLICPILPLVEHLINKPLMDLITGREDGGWAVAADDAHGGRNSIVGFIPVRFTNTLLKEEGVRWYTFIRQDPAETYAPVNRLIFKLFLFESSLVFLISILGYYIVKRILIYPITHLNEGMERVGSGDLDYRVDITTGDEIGSLAQGFNRMSKALKGFYYELENKIKARTMELEKTKNYLESILKYSSDMIITTDLDGKIVTFNEGAERILGYRRNEVIGKYMSDYYYHREDRRKILEIIDKGVMVTNYETQLIRKDGKIIDISLSISLLRDEDGKVIGTVGISKDITEWKKAQRQLQEYSQHLESMVEKRTLELKESESHLEAMLSGIADGVVFVNQDNEITFINDAAESIFDLRRDEWIGRNFKYVHSPEAHEKALQLIKDMRAGKLKSYATEIKSGDKIIYAHFSPIMHENEYLGVIFIARDRTEMKKLQNDLIQAEKFALVGKMSSAIAHELRNPLVPIGGFANLIYRKAEEGSPIKKYADIIVKEIERLEGLLKSILYFTKDIKPVKQLFNLNEVINDVLLLYNRTFSDKSIELNVKLSHELPHIPIDPSKMKQILINIFTNAIHAMEEQGGILTIETTIAEREGKNFCRIRIGDTGTGIPEEIRKHIFDPFFTTRIQGLGLGLTLTKKLIEAHGGFIEVNSTEGVGTTFTLYLPLKDEAP